MKKDIMLIDGLNMFIRNYIVNPTIDSKGRPLGGCMGFLKSLQKVVRMFQPDEIVICWDGQGGSQRRKAENKNYPDLHPLNNLEIQGVAKAVVRAL